MPKPVKSRPEPIGALDAASWVRVWDPLVRVFHWGLAASFIVAWLTSDEAASLHHLAGYIAFVLIVIRVVWGFLGTPHARFSQFVHGPSTILAYFGAILRGTEARHLGHNPVGGAMIITLMIMMTGTAVSGWMMTTDRYWGIAWVEDIHSLFANILLVLVAVHIGGVLLASLRHRENLVAAMFTGRKRTAEPGEKT